MPKLSIVPPATPGPTESVRQRLRKLPKPATLLQCPRCTGREMIETKAGVLLVDGKTRGGTKQYICAFCAVKGERVVVA